MTVTTTPNRQRLIFRDASGRQIFSFSNVVPGAHPNSMWELAAGFNALRQQKLSSVHITVEELLAQN